MKVGYTKQMNMWDQQEPGWHQVRTGRPNYASDVHLVNVGIHRFNSNSCSSYMS